MTPWLVGVAKILLALQATGANVTGVVRDSESGEPIAGAVVSLTELDRSVQADHEGRYTFQSVPAGPHHITVSRLGYASRTLHALVPRRGVLEINLALHRRPVTLRALEVRPALSLRGAESLDSTALPNRAISIAAVRNHPLLAEPDVFLALSGGEVMLRPESPSGVHVRGGASDQTAYFLDGIPVLNPYHAAGAFSAWNPDALERLQLSMPASSGPFHDAISGAVSAVTRAPGSIVRAQATLSSTQARMTVDGPLGLGAAGFVLSMRTGFPGAVAPPRDRSYLHGENGDLLAKLETPLFGGRARVLAYDGENEFDVAARIDEVGADPVDAARHVFAWHSRSIGAEWSKRAGVLAVQLRAWSAASDAQARWYALAGDAVGLAAARADLGAMGSIERVVPTSTTTLGAWIRESRTTYRAVSAQAGSSPGLDLSARTPAATVYLQQSRSLATKLTARVGSYAAVGAGALRLGPHLQLDWEPLPAIAFSGGFNRSHQFSQSLRNPESLASNIFPADLWIGSNAPGVPVARSDLGWIAAEHRPFPGVRFGAQVYLRDFAGLLVVAPRTSEPFATNGFGSGDGNARGFSLDAAMSGARYGIVASYGWQRVELDQVAPSYVPGHATTHALEAGGIVFPTPTFSIRLGTTAGIGRRSAVLASGFEWEACNLRDRGCEFGGSPTYELNALGQTGLPSYVRVDLGFRKHWHVRMANRDAHAAVFGTVTNLLDRRNALAVGNDISTNQTWMVEMRRLAPLVVGIDWRF